MLFWEIFIVGHLVVIDDFAWNLKKKLSQSIFCYNYEKWQSSQNNIWSLQLWGSFVQALANVMIIILYFSSKKA